MDITARHINDGFSIGASTNAALYPEVPTASFSAFMGHTTNPCQQPAFPRATTCIGYHVPCVGM